jgi:hypothetical protein
LSRSTAIVADYFFHGEDSEPWHAPLPSGLVNDGYRRKSVDGRS